MFGKRPRILADRFHNVAIVYERALALDLAHQSIDVFELCERRPALIFAPPARLRLHPDRERFGEVLGRMALRVPMAEMQDEITACGSHAVGDGRIALRCLAERLAPCLATRSEERRVGKRVAVGSRGGVTKTAQR